MLSRGPQRAGPWLFSHPYLSRWVVGEFSERRTGSHKPRGCVPKRDMPRPIRATKPTQPDRREGTRIALILFVKDHAAFQQSASHLMDPEVDSEVVSQVGSVREGRKKMAEGA